MKLYILRPIENLPKGDDPWESWYDKAFGFVVTAENEENARKLADGSAGDENEHGYSDGKMVSTSHPWLSKKYTTCTELIAGEVEEIIITDFAAA